MRDDSKGRFERMQCVRCGAHAMVRSRATGPARCEVCGGTQLVPVEEKPPPIRNFSHEVPRQA